MAIGDRKGLPTKKQSVSRVSKSGKFSVYSQSYHLNPFKKTSERLGKKQQPDTGSNKADDIINSMKTSSTINKRASIEGITHTMNPSEKIGSYKIQQIVSKLKSTKDTQSLSDSLLKSALPTLTDNKTLEGGKRIKEYSKIFNNIPRTSESYNIVINDLISNKGKMVEGAFSSLIHSLGDHKLLESTLHKVSKKESYDKEELLHDWHVKYSNPVGQIINYYTGDVSDNLKASVIDLWQKQNDLGYMDKGVTLTDRERTINQKWIDFNNDEAANNVGNGLLHKTVLIQLDKDLAATVYKTNFDLSFNLYNSIIYEFKNGADELDPSEYVKIKDTKNVNESNFTLHECAFYLQKSTNLVFLVAKISIKNNGYYDFMSVSKNDTTNFIEDYNSYLSKSIDTSKVSTSDIKTKISELTDQYENLTNDNSYLIIER